MSLVAKKKTVYRSLRIKLMFNAGSGANEKSPEQLMDVIKDLQALNFIPEPYLIEPGCNLSQVVRSAIAQGIRMVVVCGGDGTVSSVANAILGTKAILGIIPIGTRNNVALSLGIPTDISAAVALLRKGRRRKIDMGLSTCGGISTPFIELCSIGLFSALFSSGDDIQHGQIGRLGAYLATLTSTPPSEIHLVLDDKKEIKKIGHIVLVCNLAHVGMNIVTGSRGSYHDGYLDIIFFADLSKLDLLGYVLAGPRARKQEDPRIQHLRVRRVLIKTNPAMPIMADGIDIGTGTVCIEVQPKALNVILAKAPQKRMRKPGEILAKP